MEAEPPPPPASESQEQPEDAAAQGSAGADEFGAEQEAFDGADGAGASADLDDEEGEPVALSESMAGAPDAQSTEDAYEVDSKRGCGCRVVGSGAGKSAALLLLGALGLGLWRRRRGRPVPLD
jgi:MYXO-CTERM domain-containing protein